MREILFRGKSKKHGKWVYGGYYILPDGKGGAIHRIAESNCELFEYSDVVVDEHSVSEFTGLTDKSGKKIFEGDIVKTDFGEVGKIVWRDFMWQIDYVKSMTLINRQSLLTAPKCEVIGNIHDNLELLEAGT